MEIKTDVGEYQKSRFDKVKGQCDLIRKHGVFYIIVTRNVSEKPEYSHKGILGIDLGVNNIAVDNDREVFDSKKIEEIRHRYSKLRSNLQRVGTKSTKRKLKKVSGKEIRFKKDIDHCITNRIILKAKGTIRAIALENLNNIRSKVTVRREQRDKHSKWIFGEIRQFLEYKAKREGVPLKMVNPKDTSRECPKCHHTCKENRKKNKFECIKCGYIEMADYVAAINIAARASVNEPHGSTSFYGSYEASARGS